MFRLQAMPTNTNTCVIFGILLGTTRFGKCPKGRFDHQNTVSTLDVIHLIPAWHWLRKADLHQFINTRLHLLLNRARTMFGISGDQQISLWPLANQKSYSFIWFTCVYYFVWFIQSLGSKKILIPVRFQHRNNGQLVQTHCNDWG